MFVANESVWLAWQRRDGLGGADKEKRLISADSSVKCDKCQLRDGGGPYRF